MALDTQRLEALLEGLAPSSRMVKLKGRRATTQCTSMLVQFHERALLLTREVDSLLSQELQKHRVGYTSQSLPPVGYTHFTGIDIAEERSNLVGIIWHPMDHTLATPMLRIAEGIRQSFASAFVFQRDLSRPVASNCPRTVSSSESGTNQ